MMARGPHGALIVGIDEAGRGPLAGPVVAAAVHLPPGVDGLAWRARLDDSKALSRPQREALEREVLALCVWGIGAASVREIETMNILAATLLAMERAAHRLLLHRALPDLRLGATPETQCLSTRGPDAQDARPLHFLVDGPHTPKGLPGTAEGIIRGDQRVKAIAAASILAKCCRDRAMARLGARYGEWGFERHAGYGTVAHKRTLDALGPTPHHRRTFAPVRAAMAGRSGGGQALW